MHSWPKFAQHPNSNSSEVLVLRFGLLTWDPHIDIQGRIHSVLCGVTGHQCLCPGT